MSKYEAVPSDVYAEVWHVRWPTGGNAEPFTEAEANIIAWALDAVADGKCLATISDLKNVDGMYHVDGFYEGPTDGVAP